MIPMDRIDRSSRRWKANCIFVIVNFQFFELELELLLKFVNLLVNYRITFWAWIIPQISKFVEIRWHVAFCFSHEFSYQFRKSSYKNEGLWLIDFQAKFYLYLYTFSWDNTEDLPNLISWNKGKLTCCVPTLITGSLQNLIFLYTKKEIGIFFWTD
jgi:hypothetical protein